MKTIFLKTRSLKLLWIVIAIFSMSDVSAQSKGEIYGTIVDVESGAFMPGANLVLEGTKYGAVSSSDGQYAFYEVPAGTYNLKVTFVGFKDYTAKVTIPSSGGRVKHDISMAPNYESLDEVVLRSNRFGQTKALNDQKESETIKNVISEEQIKSFPDLNTAEVLQRVPGVTIQRSMGEGRFVALRGTAPNLTNVTVNGEQLAISNGESRVVELDVISSAQLAGIEVTKVITPNMDGNAIGGSVNLKSRSAFDYERRLLNARLGGGKNFTADGANFRASIDYADVLGKSEKFGFSFGANFARTSRVRTANEHRWGDREDVNDNEIPFALRDTEVSQSENQRDRLGFNTQLEYRFNEKNKMFLNAMYNHRWDQQDRFLQRARFDKGDYLSENQVEDMRFIKSLNDRLETQSVTSVNLGGEHQMGTLKLDYNLSTSTAFTKKDDGQLKPEFQMKGVDVDITDLGSVTPGWIQTGGDSELDGSNYELDVVDLKYENTNNTVYTAAFNFTLPMLWGSDTGELKFGYKYRGNNKDRKDIRNQWKWEGDDDLLLSQFETGSSDLRINGNAYNMGRQMDARAFRDFFFANQGAGKFESEERNDVNLGEPYEAKEGINGVYAMTSQTYGKLLMLLGVRAEFTRLDYTASNLVLDDEEFVSNEIENVKRSYNNFFPNLQFRYRASDNTNLRLAYSSGIALWNFFDGMPYSYTNLDEEEIVRGNPYLDPTKSNNFDLLGEHFFKGIGILSGGVFYKRLDNFIFLSQTEEVGGPYDGYDVEEYVNGEGADLVGVEVNWQQQFTSLPGAWSGFGIYLNYTYTNSSNIDLGPDTDREDIDLLPMQMRNVGNAALTYERKRWTARFSVNYSGKFIEEVGESAEYDEWRDDATQLDLSATYRAGRGIQIFVQMNNITNEVEYNYMGIQSRPMAHNINGASMDLGIKWVF